MKKTYGILAMSVEKKENGNEYKISCKAQDSKDISFIIPEEVVKLIQESKGISVTISNGDKPIFHCISNDSLNDLTDMLEDEEMDSVEKGDCKIISMV